MQNRIILASLVFTLAMFSPEICSSTIVEGVVLCDHGLVGNPEVRAYDKLQDMAAGLPRYRSVAGEKPGSFKLELPPGKYILTAFGNYSGVEYFSFHGANPITINDEKLWVPFAATKKTKAVIMAADSTILSGTVVFKGKPVADAQVSLYAASAGKLRGLGLLSRTTDNNGTFSFSPESGEYVLVARKRLVKNGEMPLKNGDLFCYFAGNPLSVAAGKETKIEVPCYPKDDLQVFFDEGAKVKRVNAGLARFRDKKTEPAEPYSIAGRVTDLLGKPAPRLYVTAYRGAPGQLFQMHFIRLKSEYITRTDKNGYYRIDVKDKGTYFIVAREREGESPQKGELYGLYEGNANHAATVEHPVRNVDITVSKVMAETSHPPAPGEQYRKDLSLRLGDTVINKDTEWRGEVEICGRVVVKRGVTLTIRPGTKIKFRRIDRNNDGIGDGEIRVLGRLVAKGTPNHRIRFTSAERVPQKGDWSYLLLFTSGDENVIEQCIFEYAFTGVQVHFSKAVIKDSIFRKNREGIRFGRAEVRIEHNNILNNTYGIRHTRLEGPVAIHFNKIRGNDVGIFFVPSNQNTVNFSPLTYEVAPQFEMLPIVTNNNIEGNKRYNYQLGERQGYDVLLGKNWWGTTSQTKIHSLIFDNNNDKSLGKVDVKQYLGVPVRSAGARGKIK